MKKMLGGSGDTLSCRGGWRGRVMRPSAELLILHCRFQEAESLPCTWKSMKLIQMDAIPWSVPIIPLSHIFSSIPIHFSSPSSTMGFSTPSFQTRSGGKELPLESVQSSAVASASSTQHLMASHNSRDASLLRLCVINVMAVEGP